MSGNLRTTTAFNMALSGYQRRTGINPTQSWYDLERFIELEQRGNPKLGKLMPAIRRIRDTFSPQLFVEYARGEIPFDDMSMQMVDADIAAVARQYAIAKM